MITRIGLLISAPVIWLALAAPASGDEAPRPDSVNNLSAQVTIPYQEFKRLLDAASVAAKPEDSPDIAGAVTRAQIKLSLDPGHPSGEAEFDISTFGHKWAFVPFFGLDLPITNVACENATIVPRDGVLCLLTNRAGLFKVVLDFDIPTSLVAARGDTISLRLAPTAAGQLEFGNVPAGKRILVGGKVVDTNRPLPLVVTGGETKFEPVEGKLTLSLPSTQLFIEQLEWRLYLPDNYEATAFEGNVEPASGDNTSIGFKKRLVRAETPNLEVYYRRKQGTQATP